MRTVAYLGVSRNQGCFLGVLLTRILICWGLEWGHLILGGERIMSTEQTGDYGIEHAAHQARDTTFVDLRKRCQAERA